MRHVPAQLRRPGCSCRFAPQRRWRPPQHPLRGGRLGSSDAAQAPAAAALVPPTAPMRMVSLPGRGRGFVASRTVARGEVVLAEAPLATVPAPGSGGGEGPPWNELGGAAAELDQARRPITSSTLRCAVPYKHVGACRSWRGRASSSPGSACGCWRCCCSGQRCGTTSCDTSATRSLAPTRRRRSGRRSLSRRGRRCCSGRCRSRTLTRCLPHRCVDWQRIGPSLMNSTEACPRAGYRCVRLALLRHRG